MSVVKVQGNPSGTGAFTIAAPATNTDRTLTLPDVSGFVVVSGIAENVGIGLTPAGQSGFRTLEIGGSGVSGLLDIYQGTSRQLRLFNSGSDAAVANNTTGGALRFFNTSAGNGYYETSRIADNGQQSSVVPGGSTLYPEYKCRAWVNFNGTGTVAIRASGNVSSITDNGTGDYTVNFATAMPDTNYAVVALSNWDGTNRGSLMGVNALRTKATGSVPVTTLQSANYSAFDTSEVDVAIFR